MSNTRLQVVKTKQGKQMTCDKRLVRELDESIVRLQDVRDVLAIRSMKIVPVEQLLRRVKSKNALGRPSGEGQSRTKSANPIWYWLREKK